MSTKQLSGALAIDENQKPVQIGSGFLTTFGGGGSPITLTGSVDAIGIPTNAVELILNPTSNNLKISENISLTTYDVIAKNTKESVPCARMDFIYVQGTMGDTVNLRYTIV